MAEYHGKQEVMNRNTSILHRKKADYISRLSKDERVYIDPIVTSSDCKPNPPQSQQLDSLSLKSSVEYLKEVISLLHVEKKKIQVARVVPTDLTLARLKLAELKERLVSTSYLS